MAGLWQPPYPRNQRAGSFSLYAAAGSFEYVTPVDALPGIARTHLETRRSRATPPRL